MIYLAFTLIGLGALVASIAGLWLLVRTFNESVGWGVASLFVPFAQLIFVCLNWGISKKPFLISMLGSGVMVGGIALLLFGIEPPKTIPGQKTKPSGIFAVSKMIQDLKAGKIPGTKDDTLDDPTATAEERMAALERRMNAAPGAQPAETPGAAPQITLADIETRLAELKDREKKLLAQKTKLDPKDKFGAMALSEAINSYNAELKAALAAKQQLLAAEQAEAAPPVAASPAVSPTPAKPAKKK